jgi:hypothetical protein
MQWPRFYNRNINTAKLAEGIDASQAPGRRDRSRFSAGRSNLDSKEQAEAFAKQLANENLTRRAFALPEKSYGRIGSFVKSGHVFWGSRKGTPRPAQCRLQQGAMGWMYVEILPSTGIACGYSADGLRRGDGRVEDRSWRRGGAFRVPLHD